VKIIYTNEFGKQFEKLPLDIQRLYNKQEVIFRNNWRDPRLHTKKLKDHPLPFSFRITSRYRVLFTFVSLDTTLFMTIGHRSHSYRD